MTADPVRAALLRERDLLAEAVEANDAAIAAWNAKDDERLPLTETAEYHENFQRLCEERGEVAAPRLRGVQS